MDGEKEAFANLYMRDGTVAVAVAVLVFIVVLVDDKVEILASAELQVGGL